MLVLFSWDSNTIGVPCLSRAGHVTMETVYGQMLALRLADGDEHRPLESDTAGLNVKGNLYLYLWVI